ncbi:unnamed protein product [Pseudo-nitzschia multistriata]|uniref:Uncharacterized protein n=1 Tax=Pseudo-nitzschia multistriata TaxID=183589 RepID=A0A448ZCH7_9STRA|nr:unnamed protein product [Pseudo-nitzschia multistriata]
MISESLLNDITDVVDLSKSKRNTIAEYSSAPCSRNGMVDLLLPRKEKRHTKHAGADTDSSRHLHNFHLSETQRCSSATQKTQATTDTDTTDDDDDDYGYDEEERWLRENRNYHQLQRDSEPIFRSTVLNNDVSTSSIQPLRERRRSSMGRETPTVPPLGYENQANNSRSCCMRLPKKFRLYDPDLF